MTRLRNMRRVIQPQIKKYVPDLLKIKLKSYWWGIDVIILEI